MKKKQTSKEIDPREWNFSALYGTNDCGYCCAYEYWREMPRPNNEPKNPPWQCLPESEKAVLRQVISGLYSPNLRPKEEIQLVDTASALTGNDGATCDWRRYERTPSLLIEQGSGKILVTIKIDLNNWTDQALTLQFAQLLDAWRKDINELGDQEAILHTAWLLERSKTLAAPEDKTAISRSEAKLEKLGYMRLRHSMPVLEMKTILAQNGMRVWANKSVPEISELVNDAKEDVLKWFRETASVFYGGRHLFFRRPKIVAEFFERERIAKLECGDAQRYRDWRPDTWKAFKA